MLVVSSVETDSFGNPKEDNAAEPAWQFQVFSSENTVKTINASQPRDKQYRFYHASPRREANLGKENAARPKRTAGRSGKGQGEATGSGAAEEPPADKANKERPKRTAARGGKGQGEATGSGATEEPPAVKANKERPKRTAARGGKAQGHQ